MRIYFPFLLAAALLGGCSLTPKQVIETGDRFDFENSSSAQLATDCLVARAQKQNGAFTQARATGGGAWSIAVYTTDRGSTEIAASIAVSPKASSGSQIIVWISPAMVGNHRDVADSLTAGCV